ncbi:MAG TPA: hypothetical protein VGO62_06560 [Myxococcota bacterium]
MIALVAGLAGACADQSFCAKKQQCNDKLNDDDQAVCVAQADRNINMLRANSESECQDLANAELDLESCASSLSCSDFNDPKLGGNCDDQRAKVTDASDAAGNLCDETH